MDTGKSLATEHESLLFHASGRPGKLSFAPTKPLTTQRDLSPIGSFLIMGLFGLILAMVVNIFLKSTGLDFAISAIGVLIFAGLTYLGYHKVKGYAEMAKKNPALASAKLMVAANPDIDVVSEDDNAGTLTVRDKKTGKEITMDAQDIKNGRLKFIDEKGQEVTFEGSGKPGEEGFKIESNKGSMTFGNAKGEATPDWVPAYPGAKTVASSREKTEDGFTGTLSLQTADSAQDVTGYYEKELKAKGFSVNRVAMGAMTNLEAKADDGKHTVNITIMRVTDTTNITATYATTAGEKQ